MEQLIIDVGTGPDSGTGDTINEAFNKVNDNFTFLFSGYSSPTNFNSSYISLTPSNEELANGVTDFGLLVNFPNSRYVTIMYDSALPRLDPVTNTIQNGAFRVQDNAGNLAGIYTNSISTYGNQNLNLISSGTGIVSVTGTINYEQQVFQYINGLIDTNNINNPRDPDALVNAQAMIDYVNAYDFTNTEDRIVATDDSNTYVVAYGTATKRVNIVIDNSQIAEFTSAGSKFSQILISDNRISSVGLGNDLILDPAVGGNINASNRRITNLATPVDPGDAVNLNYFSGILSSIGNFDDVDLSALTDGSILVYNEITSNFEATTTIPIGEIDAGTY
jgi:hypothetical protein